MLENPYATLNKLLNITNCIFVNRTPFHTDEEKTHTMWAGMVENSVLWKFSLDKMKEFAVNNNVKLFSPSESPHFVLTKEQK